MMTADKPVPDPSSTFSVGTTTPVGASASVSARTNQMDAMASDADGLSTTVMDIQTSQANGVVAPPTRIVYKNAGFRIEHNVRADKKDGKPKDSKEMEKYKFIFSNVTALSTSEEWVATTISMWLKPRQRMINEIRIEDSCVGEMIDKSSCESQAMMLVDTITPALPLVRGNSSDTSTCSSYMRRKDKSS